MKLFIRYECGCVGIPLPEPGAGSNPTATAIIVQPCDADRDDPADSLTWAGRDMSGKAWEYLPPDWAEGPMHARMAKRLHRADRFDRLCSALGVDPETTK